MSSLFSPIQLADLEWHQDLPYSKQFNDVYFSTEDALAESQYVYIEGNDLISRWKKLPLKQGSRFVIGETGFGTGLNFLLSWFLWLKHAPAEASLHFISCEQWPLSKSDLERSHQLWPMLAEQSKQLIEYYPVLTPGYHSLEFEGGRVRLTLMLGDATETYQQLLVCGDRILESKLRPSFVDAWFLDGFSPEKNPSIWTPALFHSIALLSKESTTLSTFSSAKMVKDHLLQSGFSVEKRSGYAQKREMIVSFKQDSSLTNKNRSTPWHAALPMRVNQKKVIVIGAGLAGCFSAYSLAKRGWEVLLLDAEQTVGTGASGNQQGIIFPQFSAYASPLSQWMLDSFLYATRFYANRVGPLSLGDLCGVLLLAHHEKESASQARLKAWLNHYPELGQWVDSHQASAIAGLPLSSSGLFIPGSGWINTPKLCDYLVQTKNIEYYPNELVQEISYDKGLWQVAQHQAPVVIIANGYRSHQFTQTDFLPIKPVRGQMTLMGATTETAQLKVPICAKSHVLPALDGGHWFGASYDPLKPDRLLRDEDDLMNMKHLNSSLPDINWSNTSNGAWAAIRAATPDYLPLVGPVVNTSHFNQCYSQFTLDSKQWIPQIAEAFPGLYVSTGFGSKGLTTIPLASEYLASLINNEVSPLPRHLIQAISPSRFLKKFLVKGT